ncbi:MAG: PQQ-dependent sugar dehydrogenase [Pseudomonadota bacterium]
MPANHPLAPVWLIFALFAMGACGGGGSSSGGNSGGSGNTTPLSITAPANITAEATGPLTAVSVGQPQTTGGVATVTLSDDQPVDGFPVGTTTITYTATDGSATVRAEQTVTIVDTQAPEIEAPIDLIVPLATPTSTDDLGAPMVTDLADRAPVIDNDAPPGDFPVGTTVVTWSATDASGNESIATQKVTLIATAPLPTVATTPVFTGVAFDRPVDLELPPSATSFWYVAEKAGRVQRFANTAGASMAETVLDLRDAVDGSFSESGLLGIAFDPDFVSNGILYVSYTATGTATGVPLQSRVSRFVSSDAGATFNPADETVLLTVDQDFTNHNAGDLAFGPDNLLYAAFGDGGGANDPNGRSQDNNTILGTIVRLDVSSDTGFAIPPRNPFADNSSCLSGTGNTPCPEIFAYGLRNPFRFSFDRLTGALWVADVGQNTFEETNIVVNGGNYGWPIFEGSACNASAAGVPLSECDRTDTEPPVSEYGQSGGQSITGGFVYRGAAMPDLWGHYVYADFVSGQIFATQADGPGAPLLSSGLDVPSFAEDENGELLLLDFSSGTLHQLVPN